MDCYFHVSPHTNHPVGTIIEPGRYGGFIRSTVTGGPLQADFLLNNLVWEAVLETARLGLPNPPPSRLNCVFGCTTHETARAFRKRFRPNAPIYRIAVKKDIPTFLGNLDLISRLHNGALVDVWSRGALSYWTEQPSGATEVLIGGPVKVVERLTC